MKALAQIRNPVVNPAIGDGGMDQGVIAFGKIIGGLVGVFFFFCFIIALIYLLLGGAQWITSGGDKGKLEEARNKITHAIVGIIVVGASWAIFILVSTWFGAGGDTLTIPSITP